MTATTVLWFRNDLRFHDHPALAEAVEYAETHDTDLLLMFHLHPYFTDNTDISNDYFFQTAASFQKDAESENVKIHMLSGEVEDAFSTLLERAGEINAVFCTPEVTSFARKRDEKAASFLTDHSVPFYSVPGNYIHEPGTVEKDNGDPYKVYTPFSRKWMKEAKPELRHVDMDVLKKRCTRKKALDQESEEAFDRVVNSCTRSWERLGEKAALERLEYTMKKIVPGYQDTRDLPSRAGTTRISPYLRTGSLSVRKVYEAAASQMETTSGSGAETFIKELAWRDFYAAILHYFPEAEKDEFQEQYRNLPWSENNEHFSAWKEGRTGFPIVDAGMRQLNQIGWMHNRLRMITASFLTKDLQIDWQKGEAYFGHKLIDYTPSSNIGGWQWAASVGTDAVPYFRVFSPVRQGERFDPEGTFIRQFLPELKHVPDKYIQEPHKMPESVQKEAGCIIGSDYPEPVVDHKEERKRAIAMFEEAKDQ
ncbi:cryptochrome/photolyase family protein [Alkalicoccus urumqiensis]|nr:deoxyribodipyrimidine photo-lyase [Alkalicoccus urumqiensis]